MGMRGEVKWIRGHSGRGGGRKVCPARGAKRVDAHSTVKIRGLMLLMNVKSL